VLFTGPKANSFSELVETINATTGRTISVKFVSEEEYIKYNSETDEGGKGEVLARISISCEMLANSVLEILSSVGKSLCRRGCWRCRVGITLDVRFIRSRSVGWACRCC
jgi:hypothetical protein